MKLVCQRGELLGQLLSGLARPCCGRVIWKYSSGSLHDSLMIHAAWHFCPSEAK